VQSMRTAGAGGSALTLFEGVAAARDSGRKGRSRRRLMWHEYEGRRRGQIAAMAISCYSKYRDRERYEPTREIVREGREEAEERREEARQVLNLLVVGAPAASEGLRQARGREEGGTQGRALAHVAAGAAGWMDGSMKNSGDWPALKTRRVAADMGDGMECSGGGWGGSLGNRVRSKID